MGIGKFITAISTMLKFMATFIDKRNGYFDALVLAIRIIAMIDFLDIDIIYFFPDVRLRHLRHDKLLLKISLD
jgi:hypothetical protein